MDKNIDRNVLKGIAFSLTNEGNSIIFPRINTHSFMLSESSKAHKDTYCVK